MADAPTFLSDNNGELSSKRLACVFALANAAGLTWISVMTVHPVEMTLIYLWIFMALGCLGLTLPEGFEPNKKV